MVAKSGKTFENVSKLFDHASHNGSNYLNGHCFVSVMLCVPLWNKNKIQYLCVHSRIPHVAEKGIKTGTGCIHGTSGYACVHRTKNVIILCDSWYVKKDLVCLVDEYENLDLIGGARADSVIYDLAPGPTGKKADQWYTEGNCPFRMILHCQMKKSVVAIWLYAGF